jgi:L-ribulokinase
MDQDSLVIGIDFGTDSARALVVDAATGRTLGEGRSAFARWKNGDFCDPAEGRFRQHPLDYLEGLRSSVEAALDDSGPSARRHVAGICVDSTGSTPAPVDSSGRVLSTLPEFSGNPAAMFWLWKDHTAVAEAAEINAAAAAWSGPDYLTYQGRYSSEWFWAKILRAVRDDPRLGQAAWTWIEECEWLPSVLCGGVDVSRTYRSACAAGHKALWHSSFGGLPGRDFLASIDPRLALVRDRYTTVPRTPDIPVGRLCAEWAEAWGLSSGVVVAGSQFDAHSGAVGAGIGPGVLVKVIGTSAVDLLVARPGNIAAGDTKDFFGMAENSILPGYVGIEAGQAAFGDAYAWFRDNVLLWATREFAGEAAAESMEEAILPRLEELCLRESPGTSTPVCLDWFNGRRYPRVDDGVRSAVAGLSLGTGAVDLYRSIVLSTAFGSRRILESYGRFGIGIDRIVAVGGVARKSPFVIQTLADVTGKRIGVSASDNACARGAAMYAAVASGLCPDIAEAQARLAEPILRTHEPRLDLAPVYGRLYRDYLALGGFVDSTRPV